MLVCRSFCWAHLLAHCPVDVGRKELLGQSGFYNWGRPLWGHIVCVVYLLGDTLHRVPYDLGQEQKLTRRDARTSL